MGRRIAIKLGGSQLPTKSSFELASFLLHVHDQHAGMTLADYKASTQQQLEHYLHARQHGILRLDS